MIFTALRASLFWLLVLMPMSALAQGQSPPAAADQQLLKAEELDALVAPIALYPDALLAQVLMASTYPLEVVQADRWATENKALKGDQLEAAIGKQSWDDSVKSLVATPDVLSMMSNKLDWTQKLGDAVLAQQPDVMDAVQRLRTKADANKKLESTKQQKVTKKQEQGKQVIVIEPTDPDTMYVPYYDPGVVYGGWPYPAYPPYYFGYPGYIAGGVIATGLAFGAGYAVGRWASGGYWGGNVNWGNNNININRNANINNINAGGNWQHNPQHRQGVKYNNTNVQQKFGNNNRGGSQDRMDFRGRSGDQVLKPGSGQANLGDRGGAGAGNRPGGGGAGDRPGGGGGAANRPSGGGGGAQRPSTGQRPAGGGGGQRPSAGQRPAGGGGNGLGNIQSGGAARAQSARGQASMGGRGGGGGGARAGGGGGGARAGGGGGRGGGGGGGGRGGGGGGRRSDITLKHDIVLLGRLDNGLAFYQFDCPGGAFVYAVPASRAFLGINLWHFHIHGSSSSFKNRFSPNSTFGVCEPATTFVEKSRHLFQFF